MVFLADLDQEPYSRKRGLMIGVAIAIPIAVTAQNASGKKRRLDLSDEGAPEQLLFSGVSSLALRQLETLADRFFGQ